MPRVDVLGGLVMGVFNHAPARKSNVIHAALDTGPPNHHYLVMQPTNVSTAVQDLPWGLGRWTTAVDAVGLLDRPDGRLLQLDGVLSPAQCDAVITRAEAVGYAATGREYPATYRNNDRLVVDDEALAAAVFSRLLPHLPRTVTAEDGSLWVACGLNPRFRSCRYRNGQNFSVHQDGAYAPEGDVRSFSTVQVYLNDSSAFCGGATRFFDDVTAAHMVAAVQPRAGRAVIFDHTLWHDGEAVTGGTKYVLRSDVLYRRTLDGAPATGHRGYVMAVHLASDGAVWSGGRDGTLRRSLAVVHQGQGSITAVHALPDGAVFLGTRAGEVARWQDGQVSAVANTQAAVLSVAGVDDGVITAHADGTLRRWNADGSRQRAWVAHHGWVWAVQAAGNGVVSAGEDGTVAAFSAEGWLRWRLLHAHPVTSVAQVGALVWCGTQDGTITVWRGGKVLRVMESAHRGAVTALHRVENGCMSGGEDGLVKHWPDDWGRPRGVFAHRAMVRGVSVLHGQGASASYDGSIGRWSV
jgi:predicted 2-oxoglutarate/Fe(II)-dependent dioxygenase YbiX